MSKRIAVVGAGISGLACAYELQKKGFDVVVFEKEARVGGRMSSRMHDGLTFDVGANHLCNLYEQIKKYSNELGIPFVPMEFLRYGVYKQGQIMPIYESIGWLSRMRLAIVFFNIRKSALNFFNLSSATTFDTVDARTRMQSTIGKEATAYLVDPFSTTYQFHGADEISLGAMKAVMASLKYHPKDWNLHQTVGGMIAIAEAIAKKVSVKLNMPVKNVTGGNRVTLTTTETQTFDAVVMASTADRTKEIYSNASVEQKKLLDATKYASTISLAFEVDADKLPDTSVVWVPRAESSTISGITNERMKGKGFVHNGKSLVCAWLHEDYAKSIMHLSDDEIFTKTRTELLKYCPWFTSESELQPFDLQRWPAAMPKFYPSYLTTVKTFLDTAQGEQNVFFCGDYLNSTWTEGALRCGERVAEAVATQLSSN